MTRYVLVSIVILVFSVRAHAITVYDSLSGYVPANVPGPGGRPSWLNGDLEQGIRISRSRDDLPLVKAEFVFRSDFLFPLTTSTTMRFYADQNGVPDGLLAMVHGSITVGARSVEQVSINLPSIILPNDPIWVTWIFGSSSNAAGVTLGGTTSVGTDFATRAYRSAPGGSWITDQLFANYGGGPPLRLTANIPEPSGILLCVSTSTLLLFCKRRHPF